MKLEYTDGCTATSLTVDGKETADMSKKELLSIIRKMLNLVTDTAVLQEIWMTLMEDLGEYEDLGHCETCGDWISKYTLEL